MKRLVPFILIIILATCCTTRRRQYDAVLADIDSLTEVDANSARLRLALLESDMQHAPESTRAYYGLLQVKANDKAMVKHTSDSLISRVARYYEQDNRDGHLAEAYYYVGRVNSDMQNGVKALLYFQKALVEDSTNVTNHLKSRIYAQMGYVYLRNNLFDEAINMQQLAHYFCKLDGDTLGMRYSQEDIQTIGAMSACVAVDSATQQEVRMKIKNVNERVKNQLLRKKNTDLMVEKSHEQRMAWSIGVCVAIILIGILLFVLLHGRKSKGNTQPVPTKRQFYDKDISLLLAERLAAGKVLKEGDWKFIESRLLATFPTFRDKLYSLYSLSDTEYHICMLIKLDVSPSNMAKLMSTASSTISQSRLRMQQKVFGGQGTAKDWDKHILSL